MTAKLDIPTSPGALTAEWLTGALRSRGAIKDASVTSFDVKVIGEGAGFMGQLAKLTLTYDKAEPGAPQSLIGKFPAAAQENREVAMFFRFYEREVNFYEQIAEQVHLRIPKCYFSAFVPETGDYVLLLEDLAPRNVGDQLAGCTVEQAELCIRELAKFHAGWWENPKLDALDWMPTLDAEWYVQAVQDGYGQAWPHFAEYFGKHLSPKMLRVAEGFIQHIDPMMRRFSQKPLTIVHADFRLDNLFFGEGPHEGLAVIDWQISVRGRGTFDVGYFAGGTLPPSERKATERDLVELYHSVLTQNGVRGYSFDQCWEDYRAALLFMIVYPVIGMGSLDLANERGVTLFTEIMQRTVTAIEDLKSYELIGG
jgi:hypothetical protein